MALKFLSLTKLAKFYYILKGTYLTYVLCTTEPDVAEKVVNISHFKCVNGAKVTIKFTSTNTAAKPTLNVSGTGAYPICFRGKTIEAGKAGVLVANGVYEFVYMTGLYDLVSDDTKELAIPPGTTGQYLRGDKTWQDLAGSAISHYAECYTESATATKIASITGFKLVTSARASIKFINMNTAELPMLNISGTGAKEIYFRGARITNEAPTLQENTIYDFIYTGTYYELVGNIASGYGF